MKPEKFGTGATHLTNDSITAFKVVVISLNTDVFSQFCTSLWLINYIYIGSLSVRVSTTKAVNFSFTSPLFLI